MTKCDIRDEWTHNGQSRQRSQVWMAQGCGDGGRDETRLFIPEVSGFSRMGIESQDLEVWIGIGKVLMQRERSGD